MQPMPGGRLLIWGRYGCLCRREEQRGRQINHRYLLVDAVRLGQDGDGASHVQSVTVRSAPYLDPSLSTRPAEAARVDGPGARVCAA
jgi:hypothetical protein